MQISIEHSWDGQPASPDERVRIDLARTAEHLVVRVDAPFYDDPAPAGPAGPTDELWNFETVELFLLAPPAHYLEIELGPHGHHLMIELEGVRRRVRGPLTLDFEASPGSARWTGVARLPLASLPAGTRRANAYALHGSHPARRFLAWQPPGGDTPDFHRLEAFAPFALDALPLEGAGQERR